MALVLTIEKSGHASGGAKNRIRLEPGEALDIGRGADVDWTLPDPARIISTKHCEIRFRGGKYWLYDVSRNGTFINHDMRRQRAAHPLSHGDRFTMGGYVIAVTVENDDFERTEMLLAELPAGRGPSCGSTHGHSQKEPADNSGLRMAQDKTAGSVRCRAALCRVA